MLRHHSNEKKKWGSGFPVHPSFKISRKRSLICVSSTSQSQNKTLTKMEKFWYGLYFNKGGNHSYILWERVYNLLWTAVWTLASSFKLFVTMTCHFAPEQPSTFSQQLWPHSFTHKSWQGFQVFHKLYRTLIQDAAEISPRNACNIMVDVNTITTNALHYVRCITVISALPCRSHFLHKSALESFESDFHDRNADHLMIRQSRKKKKKKITKLRT